MKRTYMGRILFTGFVLVSSLLGVPMNINSLPKDSLKTKNLLQNSEERVDKLLDCNSPRTIEAGYYLDTSFVKAQSIQLISESDHLKQGIRVVSSNKSSINGTYTQKGSSSANYLRALITDSNQQGFRFKLDMARNDPNCLGGISGYARWIGNNVAEIAAIDNNEDLSSCYIKFTL